jgi:hypothetical protein
MGLFGNARKLRQQARALDANMDTKSMLADAQAQMAMGTQMMAQQTANAGAMVGGTPAKATIIGVTMPESATGPAPMATLELLVQVPGLPPYPVTITDFVDQVRAPRAVAGANLQALVDPNNPQAVVLDWFSPA